MSSPPAQEHRADTEIRKKIIETLKSAMEDLETAIEAADPESPKEHKLQLQRYHEIGYLANQYRKLKRDTDLEEMAEDLAILKDEDDETGS